MTLADQSHHMLRERSEPAGDKRVGERPCLSQAAKSAWPLAGPTE